LTEERIHAAPDVVDGSAVLTVAGTLDSNTYLPLRDCIVKAALDQPRAVIVDMTELAVPAESALAVFTSARWHITRWPDVPLVLVCGTIGGRNALQRNGITRYVPVYPTIGEAAAIAAENIASGRRRSRADLSSYSERDSVTNSRRLVAEWLQDWSHSELTPSVKVVVTALVENALRHAGGATALRLEFQDNELTVVVEDNSVVPPSFRENALRGNQLSSLKIIDAICRAWGCNPTPDGKAVWCVIGPENKL